MAFRSPEHSLFIENSYSGATNPPEDQAIPSCHQNVEMVWEYRRRISIGVVMSVSRATVGLVCLLGTVFATGARAEFQTFWHMDSCPWWVRRLRMLRLQV